MRRILFLFICSLFFIASCKKKDDKPLSVQEATLYLNSYTRGMVYPDQDIIFQVNSKYGINEDNLDQAVDISPDASFTTKVDIDNNAIVVSPQLKSGVDYDIFLNLKDVLQLDEKVVIKSSVKVIEQYVSVSQKGYIIKPDGSRYVLLNMAVAIPKNLESIKKVIKVDPRRLQIRKVGKDYEILLALKGDRFENVQWDAKDIGSNETGEITFSKELFEGFNVVNTFHDRLKNTFTLYFSELIDKNQDTDGLVIFGNKAVQHDIKGNQLIIYLKSQNDNVQKLTISKGIKSAEGNSLSQDQSYDIAVDVIMPQIEWLDKGTYIPSTGVFKVPFKAIGLKQVHVTVAAIESDQAARFTAWNNISTTSTYELRRYGKYVYEEDITLGAVGDKRLEQWNEYGLDLTDAFMRKKGYIYRVNLEFLPSQTVLDCLDESLIDFEHDQISEEWFDDSQHRNFNYYQYFNYKDANNPCTISFYINNSPLSKNIHCTNVFPIIKLGDEQLVVALKELLNENPAKGAEVSLLSMQGDIIQKEKAGANGILNVSNIRRKPHAIRVDYNNEISYFSMQDGRENDIEEFDISSGVVDIDNRIFVYGDRDVWRPGDTVYVNVMLNRGEFTYTEDLPLTVKLVNPKNVLIHKEVQSIKGNRNIYTFAFPTQLDAATGYWQARIRIGQHTKNHPIRIETIKPNVVDVHYNLSGQEDKWIYASKLEGNISVDFLAGYALRQGKVNASANIYPVTSPFEKYGNYRFAPYSIQSKTDNEILKVTTDNSGKATFINNIDLKEHNSISRVVLDTKVDLPGGGVNTETESIIVSPFKSYVGIQKVKGKGWRGTFLYGVNPKIPLINVDKKGRRLKGTSTATVKIYKRKDDWWYDRYKLTNDHRVHQSQYYVLKEEKNITFKDGKATFEHDGSILSSGMYKIMVVDNTSGHVAEYYYHTITNANYSTNQNPTFFRMETDKESYAIGETMDVKLPKMQDAQALVTLEKGDKVLEAFWMDLDNPDLEINVDEDWFPNFYLNVNIVQNYEHPSNDRPLRMYAIEKVLVKQRDHILEPVIKSEEKVRPNDSFTIKVYEENDYPMDYTLAVVDNGLLNLTGFETPDPLKHFNKLFSLMIKTWDIYNELIHYTNPSFAGVFSIGGDGSLKKIDESADFNRFVPVVYHLGPYSLGSGDTKTHTIHLPNYIGSLRVMVVAASDKSFGSQEKNIRVASPLMVQTQLPRALNVTDKVTVPVTLFKDEKNIETVTVKGSATKGAIRFIKNETTVDLSNENQALGNLTFEVLEDAGKTILNIDASAGKYNSNEETNIYVNYPNGYSDKTTYYEIEGKENLNVDINAFGYEDTKNVHLSISGVILPAFAKYYKELINYPYGCLEQTASQGMAMLFINDLLELPPNEKLAANDHIDAAISKMGSFQNAEGRFNYWQNDYYHAWADVYAGHFLLEANAKGKLLDKSVFENWLSYHGSIANAWNLSEDTDIYSKRNNELTQAYRLFVLAKAGFPEKSAMNRFRNRSDLEPMAKMLLGGAYRLASMDDIAKQLFYDGLSAYSSDYSYRYGTLGGELRDRSLILYILSSFEDSERVDRFYKNWVMDMNEQDYHSTQEMGFAMMASKAYFKGEKSEEIEFLIKSKVHDEQQKLAIGSVANYNWSTSEMGDRASIKNLAEGKIYVVKNERAISDDIYREAEENNISMQVKYTDLNDLTIDPTNLKQGQEMNIYVTVDNEDITPQKTLALAVRMPSGWELINPRLYETVQVKNEKYDYQDYRDDKVYTFFELKSNASETYRFRVKANIKGDFYLPAISCENMYRGEVNARSKSDRVKVY